MASFADISFHECVIFVTVLSLSQSNLAHIIPSLPRVQQFLWKSNKNVTSPVDDEIWYDETSADEILYETF